MVISTKYLTGEKRKHKIDHESLIVGAVEVQHMVSRRERARAYLFYSRIHALREQCNYNKFHHSATFVYRLYPRRSYLESAV